MLPFSIYCSPGLIVLQPHPSGCTDNVFDNLPALAAPCPSELHSELDSYLDSDAEAISNVLLWWNGQLTTYPHLAQMALDYLSIPGMFRLCDWYNCLLICFHVCFKSHLYQH